MTQKGHLAFGNVLVALQHRLPAAVIKSMTKEVIAEDPTYIRAFSVLAQVYVSEEKYEKAVEVLDEALRLIGTYSYDKEDIKEARIINTGNKMCSLFALKRFDEAIACATDIIDLAQDPSDPISDRSAVYDLYVQAYLVRSLARQCNSWGEPESRLRTSLYLADFDKAVELNEKAREDCLAHIFLTLYRSPGFPPQLKTIYCTMFGMIESMGIQSARQHWGDKTKKTAKPNPLEDVLNQFFSSLSIPSPTEGLSEET